MSHSPGPWVVVEGTNNGWEVRGTLGQPIAIEPWHGGMEHKKYAELYRANATLIAAAPDLLEGLRDATTLIEEQRAAIAALIEALRPFAHEWTRKSKRYEACGSDWHMRMPGEWPVDQVKLKVGDFRNASALVAKHAPAQSQEGT